MSPLGATSRPVSSSDELAASRVLDLELIGNLRRADRHDDAAVEPQLDDRLPAHRRAVDELAVGLLVDDEAVEVARRVRDVAQELAVRRVDLQARRRILHADVDLAGGADRDVAVHVAEVLPPLGQLQPVGNGSEISGSRGGSQQGSRSDERQGDLLHGAPSLAVVPCRSQ